MGLRAMAWAYDQKLPCAHKFVLVTLGEFADKDGGCFPSQATLAERCGLSRQHVNKCLADLARDGFIANEQRTRANGSKSTSFYRLLMSTETTYSMSTETTTDVSDDDMLHVSDDDMHYVEPPLLEPPLLTPPTPPAGGDAGFAIWYAVYPHKVGKAAALKAFKAVRKKTPLEALIQGTHRYVQTKPPDRPWCNPSTWLNQQRWLDQPAEQSLFVNESAITDEKLEVSRQAALQTLLAELRESA